MVRLESGVRGGNELGAVRAQQRQPRGIRVERGAHFRDEDRRHLVARDDGGQSRRDRLQPIGARPRALGLLEEHGVLDGRARTTRQVLREGDFLRGVARRVGRPAEQHGPKHAASREGHAQCRRWIQLRVRVRFLPRGRDAGKVLGRHDFQHARGSRPDDACHHARAMIRGRPVSPLDDAGDLRLRRVHVRRGCRHGDARIVHEVDEAVVAE